MNLKILIVKLGSIGDVVHAMPAVMHLRQALPEARLDWVIERSAREILSRTQNIDRVIEIDTLQWRRAPWRNATWKGIRQTISELRTEHYDVVLDLQGLWKSAFFSWLIQPNQIIGWDRAFLREPFSAIFYSRRVDPSPRRENVIFEHMRMVEAFLESFGMKGREGESSGSKDVRFDHLCNDEDRRWVEEQLKWLKGCGFAILHPGANWKSKLWPVENYALLGKKIYRECGLPLIVAGGPSEERICTEVVQRMDTIAAVFMLPTLPQLAALTERAKLFVGPDTGPLHVAAACGAPIVGIYASTDPVRNGPFSTDDIVIQRNRCGKFCYRRDCGDRRCITMISVDEVFDAVQARLRRVPVLQ